MKSILTILAICCINLSNAQFISEDDQLHFLTGAVISGATYALVYSKTKNSKKAFWYSLALSSLAGLAKEIHDGYIIDGLFDTSEAISTAAGGLVVSATFNIFTGKKKKNKKKELVLLTN